MSKYLSDRTGIAVYHLRGRSISHDSNSAFIPLGDGLEGTIDGGIIKIKAPSNGR
jgi:hypothetical protein